MSAYQIIDEPKVRGLEHVIVNPIVILLVAMLLPLVWNPPFFGRWWLPFCWFVFNGYILGSSTLFKETLLALLGVCVTVAMFGLIVFVNNVEPYSSYKSLPEYLWVLTSGLFFFFLYLLAFKQSVSYEIYSYIKGMGSNGE